MSQSSGGKCWGRGEHDAAAIPRILSLVRKLWDFSEHRTQETQPWFPGSVWLQEEVDYSAAILEQAFTKTEQHGETFTKSFQRTCLLLFTRSDLPGKEHIPEWRPPGMLRQAAFTDSYSLPSIFD